MQKFEIKNVLIIHISSYLTTDTQKIFQKLFFVLRKDIWEVIKIKRLTQFQKKNQSGGAFYAIALGIGILVSTLSSLVMNAISMAQGNQQNANTNYGFRRTTIMRLSAVPSRSSISIIS